MLGSSTARRTRRPGPFAFAVSLTCVLCVSLTPAFSRPSASHEGSSPDSSIEEGLKLARQGAFEQAAVRLREAADFFAETAQPLRRSDALTALAQVYVALGYHTKAAQSLELAMTLVQATGEQARLAASMGALGQVYLEVGHMEAAAQYLTEGLGLARDVGDSARVAVILNDLGRLRASQNDYSEALQVFVESELIAQDSQVPFVAATATLNAGQASLQLGQSRDAKTWFDRALTRLRRLPASHDKAYGLVTLGLAYAELASSMGEHSAGLLVQAVSILEEAGEVAKSTGDQRALSYAFGHRGHLYEQRGRYEEALLLTRLAVIAAQQVHVPESLYRWEWQTGRLLKALGQIEEAISAFHRAAQTVQSIRPEIVSAVLGAAASFREAGGRVFFELADVLLQRAATLPDRERAQPYLVRARKAIELFKSAELRDYFRDDCVDALQARKRSLDEVVARGVAVIYPILLSDRTEVLVSLPGGIQRFAVPVTAERVTREARAFRRMLEKRTTREYLPHAQQLYDWLIRPLEPSLAAYPIDTLVVVPDGPLRTIPMAAFHDGERFLIEKYSVGTTPGIDLTDPHPLPRDRVKVLSAGLTEGVQGFPPLPNVLTELQALEQLYGSQPLLDKAFLASSFEKELRDKEFTIVHIASHGKFESRVQDSFVLTFDDKLTMDQLKHMVGYLRFRNEPLELLTLSACETAAGDDRAALGLAGVAIKAGARSALATLWFINDQASSALVAEFYRHLQDPSLSKAQALQQAQLTLLEHPVYSHPSYWAPFLLLNNWL